MCVAQRHPHGAVPQQVSHRVLWGAALNQARGKVMAQVVPAESCDSSAFEKRLPRSLESRGDIKHTCSIYRLFVPAVQHTRRYIIQRHVTGLAALRISAFDGQQPAIEIE
jgi:hypothetical protein